jgi:hypothetical protein
LDGRMTEETIHKCTACSCEYSDDEGGIQGDFGILPMSFCPTCLSCMMDMADQLNFKEWDGLTAEDIEKAFMDTNNYEQMAYVLEAILKERNFNHD